MCGAICRRSTPGRWRWCGHAGSGRSASGRSRPRPNAAGVSPRAPRAPGTPGSRGARPRRSRPGPSGGAARPPKWPSGKPPSRSGSARRPPRRPSRSCTWRRRGSSPSRRWKRARRRRSASRAEDAARGHGTVGAVAIDAHGLIAAATSTGGVPGKIAGRVGDSAIIGAGTWASSAGAASATGHGEAIIAASLCREAVAALDRRSPQDAAARIVASALSPLGAQGGIIIVDRRGRIGFAHNAEAMQVGAYQSGGGFQHHHANPVSILRPQ